MNSLLVLVPVLPLAGFFINLFFGSRLPRKVSGALATVAVGIAFLVAVIEYSHLLSLASANRVIDTNLFTWFAGGAITIHFGLYLDPLSSVMILFVTGVATLIHAYSIAYMEHDPRMKTFFVYLNLFVFSMLVLVLANNFVVAFLGWEGVGACSYWLISFWFDRDSAASAGKKAFIINRVGDFGYLLGMFYIFDIVKSLDYRNVLGSTLGSGSLTISPHQATVIALLLFVGAAGKSAQVPLFVWLVDAMEGPTPVSALIHAATMVTAGVYLMARIAPIIHLSTVASTTIAIVGVSTAFIAAMAATAQNDIKKVLAYSTVSQLGYMFLGIGSGAYVAAIFLMVTHAFYKALLFLGSGSVIHAMNDEQDIKKMGALYKVMPITGFTFVIAWLSIAGVPPFSGFFSKGDVLLAAYSKSPILWLVGAVTAVLTAYYMGREVYLVFFGGARYEEAGDYHPHESPKLMTYPLVILAVLSILGGLMNLGFSSGTDFLTNWLVPVFGSAERQLSFGGSTKAILEVGDIVFAAIGIFLASRVWSRSAINPAFERDILRRGWGVDGFLNLLFARQGEKVADELNGFVDPLVIDGAVVGGAKLVRSSAGVMRLLQNGYVRSYALVISLGVVVLLGYVVTRASF